MTDQEQMARNIPEQFFYRHPDPSLKSGFERIWKRIDDTWGSQACRNYLEELVVVDDRKERHGFDLTVMTEILHLTELHEKQFPQFHKPQLGEDVWQIADRAHD